MFQPWKSINAGNLVRVQCDNFFPADLVLIGSSTPKGICYVETKNLDGETNLKHKVADKHIHALVNKKGDHFMKDLLYGSITCELPNDRIYSFEGLYTLNS